MTLESISNLLERGFIDAYDDPAQVKKSIDDAIRERADLWSKWQTERCFRAKAEVELAALRELHKAVCESAAMNTKELAALRARIADALIADVRRAPSGLGRVEVEGLPHDWIDQRVRLVVEE